MFLYNTPSLFMFPLFYWIHFISPFNGLRLSCPLHLVSSRVHIFFLLSSSGLFVSCFFICSIRFAEFQLESIIDEPYGSILHYPRPSKTNLILFPIPSYIFPGFFSLLVSYSPWYTEGNPSTQNRL